MDLSALANDLYRSILDNPLITTSITLPTILGLISAAFAFIRRYKAETVQVGQYFTDNDLLKPPQPRAAYSDRMAYVLAEMSDLAYFQFEGKSGVIEDAIKQALNHLDTGDEESLRSHYEKLTENLLNSKDINENVLRGVLDKSGFELIGTLNKEETQGFICKRIKKDQPPYVVIAFRGTEKKVSDWLTDIRAMPEIVDGTEVHGGFLTAFNNVKSQLTEIMESPKVKDDEGNSLPLFITGHSLGGALATLTTRFLASDVNGACYTFGGPRVASYEFFKNMKTPIYRVVNSSDIVPRVPPVLWTIILGELFQLLAWITKVIPALSTAFEWLEAKLNKLKFYRHHGDLRYLTDVAAGRFQDVQLLQNPPTFDRMLWFWQNLAASFAFPVRSHSMAIYRKKLAHVARRRIQMNQLAG